MTQQQITISWIADSEQDTEGLANWLADRIVPGTVMALDGDLGAGKTRTAQLLAAALGVQGVVNSPTFTIIKEYQGRLPFYHMDVYRISEAEADELGLDEYFFGEGITLVEWASLIPDLLPASRLHLRLERVADNDQARRVTLTGVGEPYGEWCRQLLASSDTLGQMAFGRMVRES